MKLSYLLPLLLILTATPSSAECSLHNDTKAQVLSRYSQINPNVAPKQMDGVETKRLMDAIDLFVNATPPEWAKDVATGLFFDVGDKGIKAEFSVYDKDGNLCGTASLYPNQWKELILNAERSNL